jgi:hypothetical protein
VQKTLGKQRQRKPAQKCYEALCVPVKENDRESCALTRELISQRLDKQVVRREIANAARLVHDDEYVEAAGTLPSVHAVSEEMGGRDGEVRHEGMNAAKKCECRCGGAIIMGFEKKNPEGEKICIAGAVQINRGGASGHFPQRTSEAAADAGPIMHAASTHAIVSRAAANARTAELDAMRGRESEKPADSVRDLIRSRSRQSILQRPQAQIGESVWTNPGAFRRRTTRFPPEPADLCRASATANRISHPLFVVSLHPPSLVMFAALRSARPVFHAGTRRSVFCARSLCFYSTFRF